MSEDKAENKIDRNSFDPRLKACAEEIKAILAKYDVAGSISMVSKTHGEFVNQFPTWSGVQTEYLDDGNVGLRIKFKKEEIERGEVTTHLIVSHMQVLEMLFGQYKGLFDLLRSKCLISFSAIENRLVPHSDEMLQPENI